MCMIFSPNILMQVFFFPSQMTKKAIHMQTELWSKMNSKSQTLETSLIFNTSQGIYNLMKELQTLYKVISTFITLYHCFSFHIKSRASISHLIMFSFFWESSRYQQVKNKNHNLLWCYLTFLDVFPWKEIT